MDSNKFKGHAAMTGAEVLWGVSAPLGKGVLMAGVSPLLLTDCRMIGAAILFCIISLFVKMRKCRRTIFSRCFSPHSSAL